MGLDSPTQPTTGVAITLATEAYNLTEGQSEGAFLRAVGEIERIARGDPRVDVVVMDPSPDNLAAPILARHFPHLRALHLPGQSYDGQKNSVCRQSRGEFVVFLDGDCKPRHDDWLERILEPFADPRVPGVCGLTLYEDASITGKAMSILDFGFLFEKPGAAMGCYVSNNVAFRRSAMLGLPAPDEGFMRCHCFKHAQLLLRAGKPVRFQPRAFVHHELPDIAKERHRRGFDYVAALWADPERGETARLEPTARFVETTMAQHTKLALDRLAKAPPELQVAPAEAGPIAAEIRRLIEIDRDGIREALDHGEATGLNRMAREIHEHKAGEAGRAGRRWRR